MSTLTHMTPDDLNSKIEALIFVSTDPVNASQLASMLSVTPGEAAAACADLASEYASCNRGFQLREVAGGWRLFTHPAYHDLVENYVISWDTRRLSQAALETLAVIAYHQPVTRESVKAVRGVSSESVISSLIDKGLVRETGKDKNTGAIHYGTTQIFLEKFGLRALKDLPPLEQFAPDEESRRYISARLSGRPIQESFDSLDEQDVSEEAESASYFEPDYEEDLLESMESDLGIEADDQGF